MFLRQQIIADDYFTIITIIGPMINRSDASLKSISHASTTEEHRLFLNMSKVLGAIESHQIETEVF